MLVFRRRLFSRHGFEHGIERMLRWRRDAARERILRQQSWPSAARDI